MFSEIYKLFKVFKSQKEKFEGTESLSGLMIKYVCTSKLYN